MTSPHPSVDVSNSQQQQRPPLSQQSDSASSAYSHSRRPSQQQLETSYSNYRSSTPTQAPPQGYYQGPTSGMGMGTAMQPSHSSSSSSSVSHHSQAPSQQSFAPPPSTALRRDSTDPEEEELSLASYPAAALATGQYDAAMRSGPSSRQHSVDEGMGMGVGGFGAGGGGGGLNRVPSSSSLQQQQHQASYDSYAPPPPQQQQQYSASPADLDDQQSQPSGLGSIAELSSAPHPSFLTQNNARRSSTTAAGLGSGIGMGLGMGSSAEGEGHQGGGGGWQPQEQGGGHRVDEAFDEGVLRGLCDLDCGMPLLLDRMKQSMASAAEAASFFRKRAQIEEEYARAMIKLARSSSQAYGVSEGKAGTYVASYLSVLKSHESLGDNRLKFAAQLSEMSEELTTLGKEVEKHRKTSKELGGRLERGLLEQEGLVDKARARFDSAAEELERLLILKTGETLSTTPIHQISSPTTSSSSSNPTGKRSFGKAMSKLKGPKNAQQIAKQEEETRSRMGQCSDAYRSQVLGAQQVRGEYFGAQLPRILRTLKEATDEVDLGTQYHLSRYAYIFESTLVTDGLTISPIGEGEGPGLKTVIDSIDVREDFKNYMQQYAVQWQMSGQKGPRREGPAEEGFLPSSSRPNLSPRLSSFPASSLSHTPPSSRPTFGVDLGDQMLRDGLEVPRVLEKCCEAIELHGLDSMGIYRLSGTTSRVQRLKGALDRDIEGTDLLSEDNLSDINDIAAVMKLWFREMPEPLLTWELYGGFIEAAKIENDRLRHIRLHERVNDLPDPNYATLKYLMGHLDKVQSRESFNQMSSSNLAIVFGPNLLGAPPSAASNGSALADMSWQCKVIETILNHYAEIFLDDAES